ncbi:hypothetical protein C2G38_2213166 [Gigaspora rosea]|uniref:Transmembrane protein n=1 Tax=Gigaspora rosea TaxID=44941 RepID=A0A397UGF5_9GLOM|nr:hypothetical protein C2G38_2213166 [Gigaspora rosea]
MDDQKCMECVALSKKGVEMQFPIFLTHNNKLVWFLLILIFRELQSVMMIIWAAVNKNKAD